MSAVEPGTTEKAPQPLCAGVAVDNENYLQLILCCKGTAFFSLALLISIATLTLYSASIAGFVLMYGMTFPAIWTSWVVFAIAHLFYMIVSNFCGVKFFADKEPLFLSWRRVCKWVAPLCLYLLLCMPYIIQSSAAADSGNFRNNCVIVVCVFWAFTIIFPLTGLAMTLFKPLVRRETGGASQTWILDSLRCVTCISETGVCCVERPIIN
jgi:hypothetical protein